jgi:hypothetical protein
VLTRSSHLDDKAEHRPVAAALSDPTRRLSAQGLADRRPQGVAQRVLQRHSGIIQRKKEYYAYGAANTTPHIHVYSGGDCHLKILDRGRVRRYNIIQGGRRHAQAEDALAAAAGVQALVDAINDLLQAV